MLSRYKFVVLLGFLIPFVLEAQTSFTLQEALREAKANNPVLKVEKYNLSMAEADKVDAKLRPNLNLSNETVQMSRKDDFEKDPWSSPYNREMMWQLSKSFQVAGQRRNKIELANRGIDFAEHSFEELESELLAEVAEKWIDVWAAFMQMEVLETAKRQADTLVTINERRLLNHAITQTEMMRTRLMAQQYDVQHKSFMREFENLQKELQYMMGATEPVTIDTTDRFLFPIPAHPDTLLQRALEVRSDWKASQSLMAMSESNVKLQNSMAYPQPELGVIWNPQNAVPHLGFLVGIEIPLFDRNQGERKKSVIMRDQAVDHMQATRIKLENEIQIAFANYRLHSDNAEDYVEILNQSQQILDQVRYAYQNGGTTIIDFIEAQRSWLETREEYFQILRDYRHSYVRLLYSSGLINQWVQ